MTKPTRNTLIDLDIISLNPPSKEDLVVFGGTFDPIHEGHVGVLRKLMLFFHTVVIAPTSENPWKSEKPTCLATRLKMIGLVLEGEQIPVTTSLSSRGIYIFSNGYNYAEEVVQQLAPDCAGSLFWAVGQDISHEVSEWRNWGSLPVTTIVLPIVPNIHASEIRAKSKAPHPALEQFLTAEHLYGR